MPTLSNEPVLKKVHEDARGQMYAIVLPDGSELMLLHSKKGTLRGGHSHDVPESIMVLSGEMEYHKRPNAISPIHETLVSGDCSGNAAGEIHMGEFIEDTWLIEWKITGGKPWMNKDYEPWRELVRASASR